MNVMCHIRILCGNECTKNKKLFICFGGCRCGYKPFCVYVWCFVQKIYEDKCLYSIREMYKMMYNIVRNVRVNHNGIVGT